MSETPTRKMRKLSYCSCGVFFQLPRSLVVHIEICTPKWEDRSAYWVQRHKEITRDEWLALKP